MFDPSIALYLGIGFLFGALAANKEFRSKFFKGMRGFISQLSNSARKYSERQSTTRQVTNPLNEPDIQHVYKQVHSLIPCPICKGSGRIQERVSPLQQGAPGFEPKISICPNCKGKGKVWD